MGYKHSLTFSVQEEINSILETQISEENMSIFDQCKTANEVKKFLSNPKTLNTPGFVIRRYIQTRRLDLLTDVGATVGVDFEDLTENGNVSWPRDVIKKIAKKLSSQSLKEHNLTISTANWEKYLTDRSRIGRKMIFKVAFVLRMDVSETNELLLACGENPYNVRNPQEFVCYFCQSTGRYNWKKVQEILKEYCQLLEENEVDNENAAPNAGMTIMISNRLSEVINSSDPEEEVFKNLQNILFENRHEFTKNKKSKKENIYEFEEGYSLSRTDQFKRILKYLVVLYPMVVKSPENKSPKEYLVKVDCNGNPNVTDLLEAMFQNAGWNFFVWKQEENENSGVTEQTTFRSEIYTFCQNWYNHVSGILQTSKNRKYVERKDILLTAYFFMQGYLCATKEQKNRLYSMTKDNSDLDQMMQEIMEWLDGITPDSLELDNITYFRRCLNSFLDAFNFCALYVPLPFDRFILLALVFGDFELEETLLPLILCTNQQTLMEYELDE
ncbi:MAG: hypothetical protein ACLT23_00210 [Lachnospiraceae bacterium]